MFSHKENFSKFKKSEIIPSIFSDHNSITLEMKSKRKTGEFTNTWKLNNSLLNNQWIKEEVKREIKVS